MTITDRIEINPKVMMGKPVIRGTRLTVELILRKLSEGANEKELLEAYPRLSRQDIQAAIRFAADTLAQDVKEGTSYVLPVKRENEKILSFVKTASYKTVLILGNNFPFESHYGFPFDSTILSL
jgi:uncharacterized protein (DUF433 family)